MFQNKTYTGIVVEGDFLKVAKLKVAGKKLELLSLDQVRLIKPLEVKKSIKQQQVEPVFDDLDIDKDLDDDELIFGLSSEEDEGEEEGLDLENLDDLDDLDFDDFDDEPAEQIIDTDMVDESGAPATNELLLYNLLSSINNERVDLSISITAGQTIFQILRDTDFSDTKKKDLQVIVDDRLESLHGVSKGEDFYSYSVRDDGAMLLTSIDDEPQLLTLLNKTQDLYRGKLFINEIIPEEILLLGLIKANYELEENSISAVVQFSEEFCRVFFLRGEQLWIVSPIITEGVKSKKFLNTVFSKILFQLDTGEVPNLDRLIICNNSLGDTAIEFFEERFQDVDVSEFKFQDDFIDTENISETSISSFTTAIGAAWAGTGYQADNLPDISFLPKYVDDRQKIFKLQWHGFLLLFLILITPIIANHFYTNNEAKIDDLNGKISSLDAQIRSLESTVQRSNEITSELSSIQSKLVLLNELNQGTLRWTTNLELINSGVLDINLLWLTSMRQNDNTIEIAGIARNRDRIPMLADLFDEATLQNVRSTEIRSEEVFEFRYVIGNIFEDENIYTPENVQGIQEIIGE